MADKIFHVQPRPDGPGWQVRLEGAFNPDSTWAGKTEALFRARELARSQRPAYIVVHDGRGGVEQEVRLG